MTYQEVSPHLNKIAKVNMKDKKRKTGWLFCDFQSGDSEEPLKAIHFMNIRYGRRLIYADRNAEIAMLKPHAEIISVDDIANIRSWK